MGAGAIHTRCSLGAGGHCHTETDRQTHRERDRGYQSTVGRVHTGAATAEGPQLGHYRLQTTSWEAGVLSLAGHLG